MYFPLKFNPERALELIKLVSSAYDQYEAYDNGKQWNLPKGYSLNVEIFYMGTGPGLIFKDNTLFDREFQGLLKSLGKNFEGLPIGFIAQKKNDIYIIFRGTMTSMEWVYNLNINLKPYILTGYGNVHEGFLQIYKSIRKNIFEQISEIENIKNIFVGGHSLGGALATLLVPELAVKVKYKSLMVYTYGSPRVGDNTFVSSYNRQFAKNTFRLANTSDLVVSVPFPVPFLKYFGGYFSHVDTPIDFTTQKEDVEKNHLVETYLDTLKESTKHRRLFQWILQNFQ